MFFYLAPSTPQTSAIAEAAAKPLIPPTSSSSDDSSAKRHHRYTIDDFHFMKVLGKGSFGKVDSIFFLNPHFVCMYVFVFRFY